LNERKKIKREKRISKRGEKLICDKCKKPINQSAPYYLATIETVNVPPSQSFQGKYFFHNPCWMEIWKKEIAEYPEAEPEEEEKESK